MRSVSPYPVRNLPYVRSRSFSSTSPNPALRPYSDTAFIFPERRGTPSLSPHPSRRASRVPVEGAGGLGSVIERTLGCGSSVKDDEEQPLLKSEVSVTALYARRWYLLLVYSFLALLQTMSWSAWGPIAESAESVFSWGDSEISMCLFLGNLSFCVCCIPFSWLMDHKGLRVSMVVSCFFAMAGAGLRCLVRFVPSSLHIWCIYGGQLLNGVAGPVAQGGGALFSNLWFPNNQRATSTAISTFIGYGGSALAFVLGPYLVPSPSDDSDDDNSTLPDGNDTSGLEKLMQVNAGDGNSSVSQESVMMDSILSYMDYMAAATAVLFLMVLVCFPDKPPLPPSLSAATEREDFGPGLAKLLKNKQFWLISGAFCLSLGVFEVWDVVLDVNLKAIGISQDTAGWLGFYCVMAGCLTGLLICRLADFFFRQIRLFLLLAYAVSAIFVLWFILIYINVLPFDMTSIYAAIILSGVFLDGCCPLVYELICEAAYPVSEGVSSCLLQMLFVLVGMAFAAVQNIPDVGTVWMNWCLLGCLCAAIPLLLCVTDTYSRADLDDLEDQVVVVNPPNNPSTQRDHCDKEPLLSAPRSTPSPSPSSSSSLFGARYGACSCPPKLSYTITSTRPSLPPHPPTGPPTSSTQRNPNRPPPEATLTYQAESTSGLQSTSKTQKKASVFGVRRNPSYQGRGERGLDLGHQRREDHNGNHHNPLTVPRPSSTVRLNAFFQATDEDDDVFAVVDDDDQRKDVPGVHVFGRKPEADSDVDNPTDDRSENNSSGVFEFDTSYREGRSVSESSRRSESSSPKSDATGSLLTSNRSVDLSFLRIDVDG